MGEGVNSVSTGGKKIIKHALLDNLALKLISLKDMTRIVKNLKFICHTFLDTARI